MADCVFCAIVAGEAPASVVYRDAEVMAFLDIRPVTSGHLLVIPNRHAVALDDVDVFIRGQLVEVAIRLAGALRRSGLPCDGINLFLADGEAAGQEVFHVHLHLIPRTNDDGFTIDAAAWRSPLPTRAVLDAQSTAIRSALRVGGEPSISS